MNLVRSLLGLILLCLLSSCSWFNSDPRDKPAELPNVKNQLRINERWDESPTSGTNANYLALPLSLTGDRLYTVDSHGVIAALNNQTGKTLWKTKTKTNITSGVTAAANHVAVGTGYAQVMVYRADDGRLVWFDLTSNEILAKPVIVNNLLLIKVSDGHIIAFDVNNGRRLWVYEHNMPSLSLRGSSSPVVYGDKVIVGFDDGKVEALSLQSGRLLWQQRIATGEGATAVEQMVDIDGTPLIVDGKVYVASYQGNIAALDAADGRIEWQHPFSSISAISTANGSLFATASDGEVYSLMRSSGGILWKQDRLHGRGVTAPTVMGNAIVVGDADGYLHWLDQTDGHFLAQTRFSHSAIITAPVVFNNMLYVVDASGNVGAYRVE